MDILSDAEYSRLTPTEKAQYWHAQYWHARYEDLEIEHNRLREEAKKMRLAIADIAVILTDRFRDINRPLG